jgi:adenine deaminase
MVVENGRLVTEISEPPSAINLQNTVRAQSLSVDDFRLAAPIREGEIAVNLVVLQPNRLTQLETVRARVENYQVDPRQFGDDVCYLSVVPRHGQLHRPTVALLKGLHLRRGTLATTIAHDSHNIIITGHDPADMLLAVHELVQCGGGIVIVYQGRVLGKVELPLGGLMSRKPVSELVPEMQALNELARQLGIDHRAQALSSSGLALTVIPEVRITDLVGLIDVASQRPVPVIMEV